MVEIISECFRDYVDTNWNAGNHAKPTVLKVMTATDSPGKFKGSSTSCLLIERGNVGFIQVDLGSSATSGGFRVRQWRTKIFCYEPTAADLQGQMDEFNRILSKWQSGGGGIFSANDSDNLAYIQDNEQDMQSARAVDIYLTINGYYEQEAV